MEQLTGTMKQNANNARQASALAANASEISDKGSSVVNQVVGPMGDINDSSAKIADIITIIESIAFRPSPTRGVLRCRRRTPFALDIRALPHVRLWSAPWILSAFLLQFLESPKRQ